MNSINFISDFIFGELMVICFESYHAIRKITLFYFLKKENFKYNRWLYKQRLREDVFLLMSAFLKTNWDYFFIREIVKIKVFEKTEWIFLIFLECKSNRCALHFFYVFLEKNNIIVFFLFYSMLYYI